MLDDEKHKWKDLKSVVKIEAITHIQEKTREETRYYITSLLPDAMFLNEAIRKHWAIENKLHWSLDISFREDESRKRAGHTAENFSTVKKIVLNLLKQDSSIKIGMKGKRLKAAWDDEYLKKVLKI